jgi:hypothetical protein
MSTNQLVLRLSLIMQSSISLKQSARSQRDLACARSISWLALERRTLPMHTPMQMSPKAYPFTGNDIGHASGGSA